jgi:gas vesicle protein
MNRTASTLIAFFMGAATGAALGVIFAPDKGSSTRDKITYLLDKYKGRIEEIIEKLVEGKDMHSSEAKAEGEKVITDARIKAEKLLEDVDELIGQIKGKH